MRTRKFEVCNRLLTLFQASAFSGVLGTGLRHAAISAMSAMSKNRKSTLVRVTAIHTNNEIIDTDEFNFMRDFLYRSAACFRLLRYLVETCCTTATFMVVIGA